MQKSATTGEPPTTQQASQVAPADTDASDNGKRVVDDVLGVRIDAVGDRHCVTYRFAGDRPDGRFVVEQHAYYAGRDDRIGWMRLLCSGFRPADQPRTARPPWATSMSWE